MGLMWLCGIWRAFEERVILFLKNEKREKEKEKNILLSGSSS